MQLEQRKSPMFTGLHDVTDESYPRTFRNVDESCDASVTRIADTPLSRGCRCSPDYVRSVLAKFPAGLVIYWTVNNVLSMAQQWVITRRVEAQKTPAAT